jgi:hypothetical protein
MSKTAWRRGAIIASIVCLASLATSAAVGSAASKDAARKSAACPAAMTLPGNAIAPATNAALASLRAQSSAKSYRGAQATEAVLGPDSGGDVTTIRDACGQSLVARTVVINVYYPHMEPNNAAAHVTLFVARNSSGSYTVWDRPFG